MAVAGVLAFAPTARAIPDVPDFWKRIPNAANVPGTGAPGDNCAVCHTPPGQSFANLTLFGQSFEKFNGGTAGARDPVAVRSNWKWNTDVANDDPDGDHFTNGEELQEPTGTWQEGDANPGESILVKNPSLPMLVPPSITADPDNASVSAYQGSSPNDVTFNLNPATGSANPIQIQTDPNDPNSSWIVLRSSTNTSATIGFNTTGFPVGTRTGSFLVKQLNVYRPDTFTVTLEIKPTCGNGLHDANEACDNSADPSLCCNANCTWKGTGEVCQAAGDTQCDLPDTCSAAHVCEVAVVPNGTSCTATCTGSATGLGVCQSGLCQVDPAAVCGNGAVEGCEKCDPGLTACCNDTCTGAALAGKQCGNADPAHLCDANDFCDGSTLDCKDAVKSAGTRCRAANGGGCDVEEKCTGGKDCPVDAFQPAGTICRDAGTNVTKACDVPERCDGTARGCAADGFQPAGTYCNDTQVCSLDGKCGDPESDPQSKEQAQCLQKWHGAAASAGSALTKQAGACIAKALAKKQPGSVQGCLEPNQKTSAVIVKQDHAARAKCAQVEQPGFGTSATADLESLTSQAVSDAYQDVFGDDLADTVPADSPATVKCQAAISKNLSKCTGGRFTSFATCVKQGLKAQGKRQITTFVGVQQCLGFLSNSANLTCTLIAPDGSVARTKTTKALDQKCSDDPAALAEGFPGCIAEGSTALARADLYECVERASECRTCLALKVWGDLATTCEDVCK